MANYAESSTPFILGFDDVTLAGLRLTETQQSGGSVTTGAGVTYNTFSNVSGRNGFLLSLTAALSGILNSGNYMPVASASATAITLPGELGGFVRNELGDALAGTPSGTGPCSAGGSYDYTRSDPFGVGSTMTVTFNNCVQGIAGSTVTINGNVLLKITDGTGKTTVALDSDGNGTVDETTDTTWDELY